jgi:hypothetical protein
MLDRRRWRCHCSRLATKIDEHDKTRLEKLLEDGTLLREVVEDALRLRFGGHTNIDKGREGSRLSVSHLRLG